MWPFCTRDFDIYCVPAHDTRHFSLSTLLVLSLSTQTEILNIPVNHILQVSCDWILCCDWYALHGAGRQTALWPCPRPLPSVWSRIWPCETNGVAAHCNRISYRIFLCVIICKLRWRISVDYYTETVAELFTHAQTVDTRFSSLIFVKRLGMRLGPLMWISQQTQTLHYWSPWC